MLKTRPSPEPISANPNLHAYLEYNRRLQKWAWVLSSIPILIVIAVVFSGTIQLKRLQQKVNDKKVELAKAQVELTKSQDALTISEKRRVAVNREINAYAASSPDSIQTAHQPSPSVFGNSVTISVVLADTRKRVEAERAAEALRSHGYTVSGIKEKPEDVTHETTVRFFRYDRSTVAIGKDMVKLLQGIGFTVRTEFDDEFVGQPSPPRPGTYEFWIGTNPSYNPPALVH